MLLAVFTPVNAQDIVSISALALHNGDCPIEFKKFVEKSYGFKYINSRAFEARTIIEETYMFTDSIVLIKSYSVKTIMDAKGKVKGIDVAYIKGKNNFRTDNYERACELIRLSDKIQGMEVEKWDYIKLLNIPDVVIFDWLKQFNADGAMLIGSSNSNNNTSFYHYKHLFKVKVERKDGKNIILITKNLEIKDVEVEHFYEKITFEYE